MFELIQVTATYSNAVLTTLLPIFSDCVKRLDLPMSTPITPAQVERFVPYPRSGDVGCYLVVTNGLELWYSHGHVEGCRTPRSYYNMQGSFNEAVRRFYGPLNLNKDEALDLARNTLLRLGYSLKEAFADQQPHIDLPPRIGTNIVPHYRFTWDDPVFGGRAVWIEVDGNRKMVQEVHFASKFFWREPPKIGVIPRPVNPRPAIGLSVSNSYLATMLPKVSDYAKKLAIRMRTPVRLKDLERVEFVDFDWVVSIKLKNGYWFDCEKDHVAGFTTPDCVFIGKPLERPKPLEEYLGRWNLDESEAINLTRQAIRKLGFDPAQFGADQNPGLTKRNEVGKYVVPRYFLHWVTNDSKTGQTLRYATAEVDANERRLKHLYLLDVQAALPVESSKHSPSLPFSPSELLAIPPLDEQQVNPQSARSTNRILAWPTNASTTNPIVPKPSPFE